MACDLIASDFIHQLIIYAMYIFFFFFGCISWFFFFFACLPSIFFFWFFFMLFCVRRRAICFIMCCVCGCVLYELCDVCACVSIRRIIPDTPVEWCASLKWIKTKMRNQCEQARETAASASGIGQKEEKKQTATNQTIWNQQTNKLSKKKILIKNNNNNIFIYERVVRRQKQNAWQPDKRGKKRVKKKNKQIKQICIHCFV